jgi:hypothetical protein
MKAQDRARKQARRKAHADRTDNRRPAGSERLSEQRRRARLEKRKEREGR